MMFRGWKTFERHVTEVLGLDATIHSGSKFFDQGDAVTRGRGHRFPLFADAKYTEHFSHSLQLKMLSDLHEQAAGVGRRMVMPIRFWPQGVPGPTDYVVLSLHDFAELMELVHE
jgi:hypothetical protein